MTHIDNIPEEKFLNIEENLDFRDKASLLCYRVNCEGIPCTHCKLEKIKNVFSSKLDKYCKQHGTYW